MVRLGKEDKSPEAYDLYLRGVHAFDRNDEAGFEEAANYIQQALALEPSVTRAAGVYAAWIHFAQADWGYVQPQIGFEEARKGAELLLKLNPDSAVGHGLLARIYTDYDWNWDAAQREAAATVAVAPRWPAGYSAQAFLERAKGQFDDAERSFRKALTIDPLSADTHGELGNVYYRAGRVAEALREHRRALEISPTVAYGHQNVSFDLLALGNRDVALSEALLETDETPRLAALAIVHHSLGRKAESDAALKALTRSRAAQTAAHQIASVYAFRGEADDAFSSGSSRVPRKELRAAVFEG